MTTITAIINLSELRQSWVGESQPKHFMKARTLTKAPRLPAKWWMLKSLVDHMKSVTRKCLCYLLVEYRHKPSGRGGFKVFSGFFVSIRDRFFWATAGHVVLKNLLQELLDDDAIEITCCRLCDNSESLDVLQQGLPFTLVREDLFGFDPDIKPSLDTTGEFAGIDFGLLRLPDIVVKALQRNPGVSCIAALAATPPASVKIVGYYLVGVPETGVSRRADGQYTVSTYFLPAVPMSRLPKGKQKKRRAIYARIIGMGPKDRPLSDITGMSGGPVIAVERRSKSRFGYRLVGIQSGWWKHDRISVISPAVDLVALSAPKQPRRMRPRSIGISRKWRILAAARRKIESR